MILETVAVIVLGFSGGYLLSIRYAGHANALQSVIQLLVTTMWVLAALVTIWTGFYVTGALMLALFSYFWISNYRTVWKSDLRRKVGTWTPFGYDES